MSNDEEYTKFLEGANKNVSGSDAPAKKDFTAEKNLRNAPLPKVLEQLDATYISETDSDFEGVSLKVPEDLGESLTKDLFASVTGHDASSVSTLSTADFDPRGDYKGVLEKIESIVSKVQVFKVSLTRARFEYWLVGLHEEKLVGAMVHSVET